MINCVYMESFIWAIIAFISLSMFLFFANDLSAKETFNIMLGMVIFSIIAALFAINQNSSPVCTEYDCPLDQEPPYNHGRYYKR